MKTPRYIFHYHKLTTPTPSNINGPGPNGDGEVNRPTQAASRLLGSSGTKTKALGNYTYFKISGQVERPL